MHAVRTQCKVLYFGNYLNPSFHPFAEVCCFKFFKPLMHSGYDIFELSSIFSCFQSFVLLFGYVSGVFALPSNPKRVDDPYAGYCGRLWL